MNRRAQDSPSPKIEVPPHDATMVRYAAVWIALVLLTTAMWGLSRVSLGPWTLVAALILATIKAGLVVVFFMHLLEARGAIPLVFASGLTLLLVLLALSVSDVQLRFFLAAPHVESVPEGGTHNGEE